MNRILVKYLKKLNNINRSATVYKTNFSENFFKYNIETSTEIAVEKKNNIKVWRKTIIPKLYPQQKQFFFFKQYSKNLNLKFAVLFTQYLTKKKNKD